MNRPTFSPLLNEEVVTGEVRGAMGEDARVTTLSHTTVTLEVIDGMRFAQILLHLDQARKLRKALKRAIALAEGEAK